MCVSSVVTASQRKRKRKSDFDGFSKLWETPLGDKLKRSARISRISLLPSESAAHTKAYTACRSRKTGKQVGTDNEPRDARLVGCERIYPI